MLDSGIAYAFGGLRKGTVNVIRRNTADVETSLTQALDLHGPHCIETGFPQISPGTNVMNPEAI